MVKSVDLFNKDIWAVVSADSDGHIKAINEKATRYFGSDIVGDMICKAFPWFREEWLRDEVNARVIKTSQYDKMLMEIINEHEEGQITLFFKNVDEYRNLTHLWCEVGDSLIKLQHFINNSHDGIVITNGQGIVRATNQAFCKISGLTADDILEKSVYSLHKDGLIPYCSMMEALESKKISSSVAKFPQGKETVVSSSPICDQQGNVIRVLSNVRDSTEMQELYEKVRAAEARAKHFQLELNAKVAMEGLSSGLHRSRIMDELYELVKKVADTNLPLLLLGESGVGKTALAKYIHDLSERKDIGTFVHINCSAIPDSLLESELFGYEAGAFSGANKTKLGLFEIAQKGTIFLDEIGDMPLLLQAKLLNVLQEKSFYHIGGTKTIGTDARVIAATNQNIEHLISEGRFRRDLFFRLNVIPITIPALRERREDIAPLIAYVLKEVNKRYSCTKVLAPETIFALESYEWAGNIRELKNVIERLVVLVADNTIEPKHLPPELILQQQNARQPLDGTFTSNSEKSDQLWNPGDSLKATVSHIEGQIIEHAIALYGSAKLAAKKLGVDESTVTRKRSKNKKITTSDRQK